MVKQHYGIHLTFLQNVVVPMVTKRVDLRMMLAVSFVIPQDATTLSLSLFTSLSVCRTAWLGLVTSNKINRL
jgi:hypothetical protein